MGRIDSLEEPVGPDGLYVKLLRYYKILFLNLKADFYFFLLSDKCNV